MRFQIRHAYVKFAADTILEDINFDIHDTEKIAIIGRNGCGKTTLLKLIAGEIEMSNLDSDEECGIDMAGKQRIGYLKQISFEDGDITVEDEILKVFEPVFECEKRMAELTKLMQEKCSSHGKYSNTGSAMSTADTESVEKRNLTEYAALQDAMEALRGYTYRQDMEIMFQRFGFELEDLRRPIGTFSGGQQTKIAFVKLLLSRPDIMLLDEPTNHLDMPTIEWLEGYLKSYNKAVVIVSHDRMFLDRVIDVTYEIEYHKIKRYSGNYTSFTRQKEEAFIKQEKDYAAQQAEIKRLTDWIEKWKNTPTKVASARSKRKVIEHMELIPKPVRFDTKAFRGQFTPLSTSYSDVIVTKGLRIGYDQILSSVSFTLKKGERVAVIGENGKGKTTLLKTLVGIIDKLGGTFQFGQGTQWGYFDQQEAVAESANPEMTVIDDFWDMYPRLKEVEVRNALGSFLFTGEDVFKKLGQLSGGEKVRLALCKMFMERPNLLIMDEPTNHMDLVGKEALENMLKDYTGTILVVSHDRYFIKQIATGVLDFEDDKVRFYDCGYEDYLSEKERIMSGEIRTSDNKNQTIKKTKDDPTIKDVFDKKTYYNPGKVLDRLQRQHEKYEKMLAESEEKIEQLRMEQMNPDLATDYEKLMEITDRIETEEQTQESLLERMMEVETDLLELRQ